MYTCIQNDLLFSFSLWQKERLRSKHGVAAVLAVLGTSFGECSAPKVHVPPRVDQILNHWCVGSPTGWLMHWVLQCVQPASLQWGTLITPLWVIWCTDSQRLEFLWLQWSLTCTCMCMEEGQGAVSSVSTTLWFVEECEGAGDWEGGAGGWCSSSSTCSPTRVSGGGALFLVLLLLIKGDGVGVIFYPFHFDIRVSFLLLFTCLLIFSCDQMFLKLLLRLNLLRGLSLLFLFFHTLI